MSVGSPTGPGMAPAKMVRRAWWSLALYVITFPAAFVIGEGLLTLLTHGDRDPVVWQIVAAATPAILLFIVPGILAVVYGRNAIRAGQQSGLVPAIIGASIAFGFVGLNVMSYLLQTVFK